MGGNKNIPEPRPKPISGNTFTNGRLSSSAMYNDKNETYNNQIYQSPREIQIQGLAEDNMLRLLPMIGNTAATTPADRARYSDELYNPVARQLGIQKQEDRDAAATRFSESGLGNSAGFARYNTDRIDDRYAGQMSDARSRANIQAEALAGIRLAPMIQAAQFSGAANQQNFANGITSLAPSFEGQQAGARQGQQAFQNRMDTRPGEGFDGLSVGTGIAGAAIGSFFGPLGTAIGSGLGTLTGKAIGGRL